MPRRNKLNKKPGRLENCKTSFSSSFMSLHSSGMAECNCCFLNPKKIKYRENTGRTVGSGRLFFSLPYINLTDKRRFNILMSLWFRHSNTVNDNQAQYQITTSRSCSGFTTFKSRFRLGKKYIKLFLELLLIADRLIQVVHMKDCGSWTHLMYPKGQWTTVNNLFYTLCCFCSHRPSSRHFNYF